MMHTFAPDSIQLIIWHKLANTDLNIWLTLKLHVSSIYIAGMYIIHISNAIVIAGQRNLWVV